MSFIYSSLFHSLSCDGLLIYKYILFIAHLVHQNWYLISVTLPGINLDFQILHAIIDKLERRPQVERVMMDFEFSKGFTIFEKSLYHLSLLICGF